MVEECQWMAACNPSLSFTTHPRFFPVLLLYDRPPLFPSHLRCTVTSLIPGRQADRRTLKPCSQRAFPIFHLRSTGRWDPSIHALSFLFPRPCRNKTAATKRIDASRCKFVLFFTAGHPAAAFASPRCSSLLTRDFYFNDGLSWIALSSTLFCINRILPSGARFYTVVKMLAWRRYSFVSSLAS